MHRSSVAPSYHVLEDRGGKSGDDEWRERPDLDRFLAACYKYHAAGGWYNLMWARVVDLLQLLVAGFVCVLLAGGLDYSLLRQPDTTRLSDALVFGGRRASAAAASAASGPAESHGTSDLILSAGSPGNSSGTGLGSPVVVVLGLVPFALFWLWLAQRHLADLAYFVSVRRFFVKALALSDDVLLETEWARVAHRISRVSHLSRGKARLSELDVANRIMRRENYIIAIVNRGLLPFCAGRGQGPDQHSDGAAAAPQTGAAATPGAFHGSSGRPPPPPLPARSMFWRKLVHTRPVMWGLSFALFGLAFGDQQQLNREFLDSRRGRALASQLRRRFRVVALCSGLLSPFLVVYVLIYAFLRYSVEVKASPRTLTARSWSAMALWTFREFNELPHVSRARLQQAQRPADRYLNSFPSPRIDLLGRFVAFVCTASIATLLVLGTIEDDVLFRIEVLGGRNGVWWLGVLGAVLAGTRTLTGASAAAAAAAPDNGDESTGPSDPGEGDFFDGVGGYNIHQHEQHQTQQKHQQRQQQQQLPQQQPIPSTSSGRPRHRRAMTPAVAAAAHLRAVATHTHYFPSWWRRHPQNPAVRSWMQAFYELKPMSVANEALAVVLGPYLFGFRFVNTADELIRFVRDFTVEVDGVGPVCRFALFDDVRSVAVASPVNDGEPQRGNSEQPAAVSNDYLRTQHGKLEQSALNFQRSHPDWQGQESNQQLLNSVAAAAASAASSGDLRWAQSEAQFFRRHVAVQPVEPENGESISQWLNAGSDEHRQNDAVV